jgi:hypothetical protein
MRKWYMRSTLRGGVRTWVVHQQIKGMSSLWPVLTSPGKDEGGGAD